MGAGVAEAPQSGVGTAGVGFKGLFNISLKFVSFCKGDCSCCLFSMMQYNLDAMSGAFNCVINNIPM